jgi:hypothetical protein
VPFGFGHHDEAPLAAPATGVRVTALVTDTERPVENLDGSRGSLARTQILVDLGAGPVVGLRELPLDPEHWLTIGQSIPVFVNPTNPNDFTVDWSVVPSIAERVAAQDPTLVDPLDARLKSWDALSAAGLHTPDMDEVAPQVLQVELAAMRAQYVSQAQAFAKQVVGAASLAAPDGYRRAIVAIATTTARWEGASLTSLHREVLGKHTVVLAVTVAESRPYAVLVTSFQHKERAFDANNPGLPALVSIADLNDVQVQWDEMSTPQDVEHAAQQQARGYKKTLGTLMEQHDAAVVAAQTAIPRAALPADVSSDPKAAAIANANATLARMSPIARPAMIAYYRSIGIEVDEGT